MTVYVADDFGETLKSDESPVTQADLAARHILVDGLRRLTQQLFITIYAVKQRLSTHRP